jgi:hypothetical protein
MGVIDIPKQWAGPSVAHVGSNVLHAVWASSNPSEPWSGALQDLASRINSVYGTHLQGSDFNPPGGIKTVDDLVLAGVRR